MCAVNKNGLYSMVIQINFQFFNRLNETFPGCKTDSDDGHV